MKIKYIVCLMATVAITRDCFAQYASDVLLYSTAQSGSTARIKAIGNAQTAIGGDLSSVSGNPAGLGFFTRSEASFTPEFNSSNVKSGYLGQNNNTSTGNLNFNNASAVFYNRLNTPRGSSKEDGLLSFNFGVSYNRTNDYYENVNYSATNKSNSISNYYADQANANGVDTYNNSLADWGYYHYLVNQLSSGSYVSSVFPNSSSTNSVTQTGNITRDGGESQLSLSFGGNFSNSFYFGGSLDITSLRYDLSKSFTESGTAYPTDNNGNVSTQPFNSVYVQNQTTKGAGVDLKLGVIFKPVDALRLGATITTPTFYSIQDDYSEGVNTQINGSTLYGGPADYPFNYTFTTPWKFSGGAALFFGKNGFITGDIDYVDYSSISIASDLLDGYDASNDNGLIKSFYKSNINYRVGGELKLDQLSLRAGYNVIGTPYRYGGTDTKTISGGFGYRFSQYYFDVTYTNVQGVDAQNPYTSSLGSPVLNLNQTINNVYVTVGYRF